AFAEQIIAFPTQSDRRRRYRAQLIFQHETAHNSGQFFGFERFLQKSVATGQYGFIFTLGMSADSDQLDLIVLPILSYHFDQRYTIQYRHSKINQYYGGFH